MKKNATIVPRRPQPLSSDMVERIRKAKEAERSGALDAAAKLYSMAYLTFTQANTYAETAISMLEPYDLLRGKMKTTINNLKQSFDAYDIMMQRLLKGNEGALQQLCFDTDTLNDLLDAFMLNKIEVERGPYYSAKLFLPEKRG